MKDKRVVFMGTPEFSVPVLEMLIENTNVVLVVTQPDKEVGRHHELKATPVKECALKHNIEVYQPIKIRNEYEHILEMNPDIIITCAYGQIIPSILLDTPKYKAINVHASLLPKLRGGSPLHKCIIDGYKETGVTIMYMAPGMDDGDIITQRSVEIKDTDNVGIIHDKLSIMGRDLLLETLPNIFSGNITRTKQDPNEVTYAYNIKREEEKIDFNKTAREVFNQIRGLSPVPGANLLIDDQEFKIYRAEISNRKFNDKKIGCITGLYKNGIGVMTGTGEIILTDIKPFGKKRMTASSYINGLHDKSLIGKVLK